MKSKKVLVMVLVAVFICLTVLAVAKTFLTSVPVFAPSFLPTRSDIRKQLKGDPLKFPLKVPAGYEISIFADLKGDMPRVLTFDPGGTLIASITNNGKVVAVTKEKIVTILSGLKQPHGIAFANGKIYVAETNSVSRYDYNPTIMAATNKAKLFDLPSGGGHFTRTIKINDGKLYVTIGSSCNVCEEKEPMRASMWVSDLDGKNLRSFAQGLRNTVFFTFDKQGQIWGNDMGRDLLGDKLPPEDLNIIKDGANYGWPFCYGDMVRDGKFEGNKNIDCSKTLPPTYKYPAHIAPLGITFDGEGNLLSAWHGSWNSSVPVGYKVVKLTVKDSQVIGQEDFITGFLQGSEVLGRPVDLTYDQNGNLFISDDKAGLIYLLVHK